MFWIRENQALPLPGEVLNHMVIGVKVWEGCPPLAIFFPFVVATYLLD